MENIDKIVEQYILDNGLAVLSEDESRYGWANYDIYTHQVEEENCAKGFRVINGETSVIENSVSVFVDTFTGRENEMFLEIHGNLSCDCGDFNVSIVRVEDSLGNFVRKIKAKMN